MIRNRNWPLMLALAAYLTACPVLAQNNNGHQPPPQGGDGDAQQPPLPKPPVPGQGQGHHQWSNKTPEQRAAHRQKMLQRFDANGDGVLDANEKANMRAFIQQRRAQRAAQGGGHGGHGGNSAPPANGANQ